MAATNRPKIKFESVEELLGVPVVQGGTEVVRIRDIIPFKDHPFKVLDDDKMKELIAIVTWRDIPSIFKFWHFSHYFHCRRCFNRRVFCTLKSGISRLNSAEKEEEE